MLKINEFGRSMVEMLGVLAIIGVLSVAGIAGYTMAMNKYRANEVAQSASMLLILAQTRNHGDGDCLRLTDSNLPQSPGGINLDMLAYEASSGGWKVAIKVSDERLSQNDKVNSFCDAITNIFPIVGPCGSADIDDYCPQ